MKISSPIRTTVIITTIIPILVSAASARIGETVEQCQQRYGKPIKDPVTSDGTVMRFYHKNDIDIAIRFIDGKAVRIRYQRGPDQTPTENGMPASDDNFLPVEIQKLIKNNLPQAKWGQPTSILNLTVRHTEDLKFTTYHGGNLLIITDTDLDLKLQKSRDPEAAAKAAATDDL